MSSQGFSFPPPPPPPPTQQQPPAPYPPSQYGQTYHGHRGGYGGGGYHRGRGRGHWNQGGRGGHVTAPDVSHQPPAPGPAYQPQVPYQAQAPPAAGYAQANVNYPTYPPQPLHNQPSSVSPQAQYVAQGPPAYHQPPSARAAASYASQTVQSQYPRQPGYDAAYNNHNHSNNQHHHHHSGSSVYPSPYATQSQSSYPPLVAQPPHQPTPTVQPPMMGPPMRWGFEAAPAAASYHNGAGGYRGQGRGHRASNSFGSSHSAACGDRASKHHPGKRNHASAFGKPQSTAPRVPAPAPVPSFGLPLLPSKPPAPADDERKAKKKKRRHNQLGLTPKTDEHESSEEEDYVDEEARLAGNSGGAAGSVALQFTYRGQTSTLQSPAEIAAWIEERKKRFPTQARIEEKRKALDEAKKARQEANRQSEAQREEKRQEARRLHEARMQKEREKLERKEQAATSTDAADAVEYALRKAEKLRRKLAREERRVAKAEAEAEQARLRLEALRNGSSVEEKDKSVEEHSTGGTAQEPDAQPASGDERVQPSSTSEGPTMPRPLSDSYGSEKPSGNGDVSMEAASHAAAVTGAENTDGPPIAVEGGSDWSSSSMSEDTPSGSEASDADSPPEEASSRRVGPERVPPPPREHARDGKKQICRHFARSGHCLRGPKCRFSHEGPERSQLPSRPVAGERQGRKGLLNALLERQQEEEDRRVMQAIMWMGENGLLEEPEPTTTSASASG